MGRVRTRQAIAKAARRGAVAARRAVLAARRRRSPQLTSDGKPFVPQARADAAPAARQRHTRAAASGAAPHAREELAASREHDPHEGAHQDDHQQRVTPTRKQAGSSWPPTCIFSGGGEGNRTPDTGIFSPLLYQLSYPAEMCTRLAGLITISNRKRRSSKKFAFSRKNVGTNL